MKYKKGDTYRFTSRIDELDNGNFIVTKVGNHRKYTNTIFIYFKFLTGDVKCQQSFMIGSEFDNCCTQLNK